MKPKQRNHTHKQDVVSEEAHLYKRISLLLNLCSAIAAGTLQRARKPWRWPRPRRRQLKPRTERPAASWRGCWRVSRLWPTTRSSMQLHCRHRRPPTRLAATQNHLVATLSLPCSNTAPTLQQHSPHLAATLFLPCSIILQQPSPYLAAIQSLPCSNIVPTYQQHSPPLHLAATLSLPRIVKDLLSAKVQCGMPATLKRSVREHSIAMQQCKFPALRACRYSPAWWTAQPALAEYNVIAMWWQPYLLSRVASMLCIFCTFERCSWAVTPPDGEARLGLI